MVRYNDGKWSAPELVVEDGWEISGCPVNGPAIESDGETTAAAWYTQAETPSVKLALESANGGFNDPVLISDANPLGRVDVCVDAQGSAWVSWMEEDVTETVIKVVEVLPDGTKGHPLVVAQTDESRASGFPKMVHHDDQLILAWTVLAKWNLVKVISVDLSLIRMTGLNE